MVDWSIILCANNHKTGNGTGTGRRTVTAAWLSPRKSMRARSYWESFALSKRYLGKLWPILSDYVCNNLRYYPYFDRCLGDIHNKMTSSIWWLATLTPAHLVSCYCESRTAISCILWTESRIHQTGAFKNDQNIVFLEAALWPGVFVWGILISRKFF